MKKLKIILLTISVVISLQNLSLANTINIDSFEELLNSTLNNGDTYNFTNNLDSTESIDRHFFDYNINFDGNLHYIDGENKYGGFILSRENNFNEVIMQNCVGQLYQNSNFAGAIFNFGGNTDIISSEFKNNYADSSNSNFGIGGAVYNLQGGEMMLQNANFESNYTIGAGAAGGAVSNGYNDSGTARITINDTNFNANHSSGYTFAEGGALNNTGIAVIDNSSFENNYAEGLSEDRPQQNFIYGGAINNLGNITVNNTNFNGNYIIGHDNSVSFGGAIFNSGTFTADNITVDGNSINSSLYGDGGAIYNNTNANMTLSNSLIANNSVSSQVTYSNGGALYNAGTLTLDNTTMQDNYDRNNEKNDIYNTGTINFNGEGTNSIQSGIKGNGTINKNDTGILNLGGSNQNYTGNFNFNDGTLNLLSNSQYFNAQNTSFGNNINFNMANNEINNINFGNLNLAGTANIYADVNLTNSTMDRINASSVNGSGSLFVAGLNLEGTPKAKDIIIPFADNTLKDYVSYTPTNLRTPLYNYNVSYDSSNGNFQFIRGGFDSSILAAQVATQLAGYLTQIDTYRNVFANLDMVMITPPDIKTGFTALNKIASTESFPVYSPFIMPEENTGIWFKPYSTFESVGLKNGPSVSNVSYGSIVGAESGLKKLDKGWYSIYGAYVSYNGSHQAYDGNSIYNNGGLGGLYSVFYKGNFFTAWTANAGANSSEASTYFGQSNFTMFNTGIAQMTGYNAAMLKKRLIIQPALIASYSFVNTFNHHTYQDIQINTRPLHALQIEPRIKLIGNFKNYLQPYIAVSMVWNIIDHAKFQADDVYLPNLAIKPFVQYGAGVQKRWGERVTGFMEAMIRNGGRNGIALQFGFRISI